MKKILLVFNKKSGKNKAGLYTKTLFKRLTEIGVSFKFVFVGTLPKISDISKYDTIVAVGGDGTVLSILPYVVNTDKKLGIIPCGTANLFAEKLGIPKNINKALDIILFKKTKKIDIGKIGDKFFSLRVGFGFDANIINSSKDALKTKIGYFAYVLHGIINAFKLSEKTYTVKIDDKDLTINASSIIVSNAGNMFKNLFTVAPRGSLSDGKLDVFILSTKNFWDFMKIFFQIIFGNHKQNSDVMYTQASSIYIKTKTAKCCHVDGEIISGQKSFDIKVLSKALEVLIP